MSLPTLRKSTLRLYLVSVAPDIFRTFYWVVRDKTGALQYGEVTLRTGAVVFVGVSRDVPIVDGELVYCGQQTASDGLDSGAGFGAMTLLGDGPPGPTPAFQLCSGWATQFEGPQWPTTPVFPRDGLGSPAVWFEMPDPAAGAPATLIMPSIELTEILAARMRLVTSATVANRRPRFEVNSAVIGFADWMSSADVTASQDARINFYASCGTGAAIANLQMMPGGRMSAPRGATINMTTISLQPTDQVSVARFNARWRQVGT